MPADSEPQVEAIAAVIVRWIRQDRSAEGLDEILVTPDTELLEEGVFDSAKLLEFVVWLESTYGIAVGVEQLTPTFFATARTVAAYVAQLRRTG